MTRLILLILLIPMFSIVSCKRDGKSRTQVQTTDFEIPEQPPVQQPPVQQNPQNPAASPTQMFMEACLQGEMEKVQHYLQEDQDVNVQDEEGRTAMMLSSFNGHREVVELLLQNKAEVNTTDYMGRSALMYASTGHFPETVELLLSRGADPNLVDKDEGFTALMFAGAEGNIKVVRLLLEHGANPNFKDKDGDTAESFARQNGHVEVADLLRNSM